MEPERKALWETLPKEDVIPICLQYPNLQQITRKESLIIFLPLIVPFKFPVDSPLILKQIIGFAWNFQFIFGNACYIDLSFVIVFNGVVDEFVKSRIHQMFIKKCCRHPPNGGKRQGAEQPGRKFIHDRFENFGQIPASERDAGQSGQETLQTPSQAFRPAADHGLQALRLGYSRNPGGGRLV